MIRIISALSDFSNTRDCEYIGRANKWKARKASPLANPFRIGRDGDRDTVVDKYAAWLSERISAGDRAVLDELERLTSIAERTGSLTLVCWCPPGARCHGDVIKAAIEGVLRKEEVA